MREEYNCLFEKVPFEIYVCKKKETIIKLLCYRKERNFMLYSTTEEQTRPESLITKSQFSLSLDPLLVV